MKMIKRISLRKLLIIVKMSRTVKRRKCSAARTQHSRPRETNAGPLSECCICLQKKQIFPAGEVEIIFPIHYYSKMLSWHAKCAWLDMLGLFHWVPRTRWNHSADGRTVPGIFCSAWGSSDGRLKHSDISSLKEVVILPVNQRVPLVEVLL